MSALEAMSDRVPLREDMASHRAGLVANGTAREFNESIARLLDTSGTLRVMGEQASSLARAKFDVRIMAGLLKDQLCSNPS